MPRVKPKVTCRLSKGLGANSGGFKEIVISVSEGEFVLELVRWARF